MWKHGVTLLLALGTVCAYDVETFKEGLIQFRIKSQNLHVTALERQVEELEHEFDQLGAPVSEAEVAKLKARLQNLEDNVARNRDCITHSFFCDADDANTRLRKLEDSLCTEREFSCGGQIPECVSHFFVCDGRKDCRNGHDEDEEVCSMDIIQPGKTFKGTLYHRRTYAVHIFTISQIRRSKYGTGAWVNATITTRIPEDNFKLTYYHECGYYSFGLRKMLLVPTNQKLQFTITCFFPFEDNDHLYCFSKTTSGRLLGVVKQQRV